MNRICRNFLWAGDPFKRGAAKVKWGICTLPKDKGGLGLKNIEAWADKLAVKLVLRAITQPSAEWAALLLRDVSHFHIKGKKAWNKLPFITVFFGPHAVTPVGSPLLRSLWGAWMRYRKEVCYHSPQQGAQGMRSQDSVWWPLPYLPPISERQSRTASRIHQKGIKTWADLWMVDTGNWITDDQLIIMFKLRPWELQLVRARINSFPVNDLAALI